MWVYMITAANPIDFIKKWRKREGLSQADVAASLGVSTGTVGDFESGRRDSPRFCLQFSVMLSEFDRMIFFDLVAMHYAENKQRYLEVQEMFNELRKRGKLHEIDKDDITLLRANGVKIDSEFGKWVKDGKIRKRKRNRG